MMNILEGFTPEERNELLDMIQSAYEDATIREDVEGQRLAKLALYGYFARTQLDDAQETLESTDETEEIRIMKFTLAGFRGCQAMLYSKAIRKMRADP